MLSSANSPCLRASVVGFVFPINAIRVVPWSGLAFSQPPLFANSVANKGLLQNRPMRGPWVSLASRLGDPWVTLGSPNPKPNPKQAEGRSGPLLIAECYVPIVKDPLQFTP